MDQFVSDNMTSFGIALILSIALFGAVRASQIMERNTILKHFKEFDLEKRKLKTQFKLEVLWKDYSEKNGNLKKPEDLDFKDIVENGFIVDESLQEQILGLNKIYLDLISHGTDSSYFIEIVNSYGPFVGLGFKFYLCCSGRLKGAEIARTECGKYGKTSRNVYL